MNAAVPKPEASGKPLPHTISEYLAQLREALRGAEPALIQDALYDAEEYLRSELAERKGEDEASVIASVAGSYGNPEEVADIYRDTEVKVTRAMRTPPPPPRSSALGQFFGVAVDPRTYSAMFYMLLSLATGIFYFTWAVVGMSLSLSLSILIIGLPVLVLFFGSVRVLSIVEGRIVEVMLGERMPRRPLYSERGQPWTTRIVAMFTDPRSWSTLLYMLLMLPLGIVYFTLSVTMLSLSLSFIAAPFAWLFGGHYGITFDDWSYGDLNVFSLLLVPFGIVLLFAYMHAARGIGHLHGQLAKHLLVRSAEG
ncbi:MAG TPA: sensor domain-containing protein [Xanthomonadaceae bacterium]|nr:sensor domain-containing protein [Xanthomonadaceae bacterium]